MVGAVREAGWTFQASRRLPAPLEGNFSFMKMTRDCRGHAYIYLGLCMHVQNVCVYTVRVCVLLGTYRHEYMRALD